VALQLQTIVPGVPTQRMPLGGGRTRVQARPGSQYSILDDVGQVPAGATIKRVDNSIVIGGLPDNRSVEISDFFTACGPDGATTCQISTSELGGSAPITPSSDPLGALPDGSFLLYGGKEAGAQSLAAPIIAASDNTWKAVGAGLGGLAIAGLAVGAGGGSKGETPDTNPPIPPTITSKAAQNSATPTFTGTGEPGSAILLRIDVNGNGVAGDGTDPTFTAVVGADGNWAIPLAGSAPILGSWSGTLPDGNYAVSVVSRDAAGNASPPSLSTIAVDSKTPAAPTIDAIAGDGIVSGAEAAAGVTLSGTGEAGTTVRVTWGTTVRTGTVGADGKWSFIVGTAEIPTTQGASLVQAVLTDAVGNTSGEALRPAVIDTAGPVALSIALASDTGSSASDGVTRTGVVNVSGVAAGYTWQYTLDGGANWLQGTGNSFTISADGIYQAQVRQRNLSGVDSDPSPALNITIDTVSPSGPVVTAIAGDNVVNLAESLAGVAVSGTGEAGATVTVVWGDATTSGSVAANGTWSLPFGTNELPQAQGARVVSTTLTDAAGNVSTTISRAVVIDTVAPAAPTVTSGALTSLALPIFTGTAEANAKVRVSIDLAGDGSIDAVYETTASAVGAWSVNTAAPAAGTTLVSGNMGAGLSDKVGGTLVPNTLSIVATDTSGNLGTAAASTISRDSTIPAAPTINNVGGVDNIVNLAERGTITISGTVSAVSSGQPVTVTWGGISKTVTATGTTWSTTYAIGEIPPDGAAPVTAISQSATGVPSVQGTLNVAVDGTVPAAPSLALTAASDSGTVGDNLTNDTTPTVRVALNGTGATEPVVNDVVRLRVAGTQVGTATLSATDIANNYVDITTSALAAGSRTIAATVTDVAGNTSPAGSLTLTINTSTPGTPVPTLTAASNSGSTADLVTNDATPTIRVDFSGAAAGDVVTLTVGGITVGTATLTSGDIAATFVNITTSALVGGARTITATVTNSAGTVSTAGTLALTIDTVPPAAPTITLTAASDSGTLGDGITNDATPTVRIALNGAGGTAPVAGDVVTLTVAGTQVGTATLLATDIGNNYVDITTSALAAGSRTIAATVTDVAGNTSPAGSLALTIDTPTPGAPVPTLTAASNSGSTADLVTNDATPTIRVDFSGAAAGDVVTLTVGGTTVGTATLTSSDIAATFVNITTIALVDGARTITATVTNGAGTVSTAGTLALTIDTTLPLAPSIGLTAASDSGTAGDFITLDTTPTLRVTLNGAGATAPVAGDVVTLTVGGLTVGTATLTGTDINNDFVEITTSALTPGAAAQTVSATVLDIAGNTSTASTLSVTISNDATAPAAPTLALAPVSDTGTLGDGITNDATPVIRVTFTGAGATLPVAGDFVQLTVGGTAAGTATLTGTNITNGYVDITSTVTLANGAATAVNATIRDIPGNTSTAGAATITADTSPPPALVAGTNFTFSITDDLAVAYTDINTAINTGTATNPDTSPLVSFNLITAIGAGESIVISRSTLLGGASVDILTVTATGAVTDNAALAGNTGTAEAYAYRADYVDNAGNRTQLDIDAAGTDNLYIIRVA